MTSGEVKSEGVPKLAEELHELLNDLPREAWPKGVKYWGVGGRKHFYRESILGTCEDIPAACVPLLFEASILRHLIKTKDGGAVHVWNCGDHWHVDNVEHSGSLLECLALAAQRDSRGRGG